MFAKTLIKSILYKFNIEIRKKNRGTSEQLTRDELINKFEGATIIGSKELISVGESVSFGGIILYANAEITIGDFTMIAINSILHTSTHDYNSHPMWEYRIDKPINIGKHVWIGTGSIILPGVKVGDYSVIAAGSVVSANVPEGAIVAGNPARIIKYRSNDIFLSEMSIHDSSKAIILKEGFCTNTCKIK